MIPLIRVRITLTHPAKNISNKGETRKWHIIFHMYKVQYRRKKIISASNSRVVRTPIKVLPQTFKMWSCNPYQNPKVSLWSQSCRRFLPKLHFPHRILRNWKTPIVLNVFVCILLPKPRVVWSLVVATGQHLYSERIAICRPLQKGQSLRLLHQTLPQTGSSSCKLLWQTQAILFTPDWALGTRACTDL